MPNIFDYTDYRVFLREAYQESRRENAKFSYRYVASKVGFTSPGFFANVLKGDKHISLKLAFKFADLFKLGRKEREYLELLILFHKAGGNREKEEYLNRLLALRGGRAKQTDARQYEFYEKWYYTAVREALALFPFQGDYAALATVIRPAITVTQARKSIEVLERLGLVVKGEDGTFERTDAVISVGDEISKVLINAFQVQAMELAKQALDDLPSHARNFSTLTLSLSAPTYTAILEELRTFRRKLLEMARNSEDVDRIYQMNFQVFPLTALPEDKKVMIRRTAWKAWGGALGAAALAAVLSGCLGLLAGRGGGSETETKAVALGGTVRDGDGRPAAGARVIIRPTEYVSDPAGLPAGKERQETIADAAGAYQFRELPLGQYRVEATDGRNCGAILDVKLDGKKASVRLPIDSLLPLGGVSGNFAPDSDLTAARYVQVYGMERLVRADPVTGAFNLKDLPPGKYDLRYISVGLYRPPVVGHDVVVVAGSPTPVGEIKLGEAFKLSFRSEGGALIIDSVGPDNPVILDNDEFLSGVDAEYIFVKASLGKLDLRGNVVTRDFRSNAKPTLADQVEGAVEQLRIAARAHLTGIPDAVMGAAARLAPPASGRLEDLVAVPSAGSKVIVAQARLARPGRPLVVVVGGAMTTVAHAYLTDPSIAANMVVFGVRSQGEEPQDTLAQYLVTRNCRYVQWGRGYGWDVPLDTARLASLPTHQMGNDIRVDMQFGRNLGDMAPVAYLFRKTAWSSAQMTRVGVNLGATVVGGPAFDALDIPAAANNWSVFLDEFLATVCDPLAYPPWEAPGTVQGPAFARQSNIGFMVQSNKPEDIHMVYSRGAFFLEYALAPVRSGAYAVTLHFYTEKATQVHLARPGKSGQVVVDLPADTVWQQITTSVNLDAGKDMLRVSGIDTLTYIHKMEFR